MDLTQLTHYLVVGGVQHVIDEPVGFDGLKTTIKRGNYHGMSAEVSVGTLEFYNSTNYNAATIIRNAYNADIDTEVTYKVMWGSEVVFTGVVDLSTYSEASGNATKISCKVGEIGVKTTFNNRTETEVDLNRETTLDGAQLAHKPAFKSLRVPRKTIVYTNDITAKQQVIWDADSTNRFNLADDKSHQWINIPPSGAPRLDEFGEVNCMADIAQEINADDPRVWDAVIGDYYTALFAKGSGWDEKYGSDARYDIEYDIEVKLEALGDVFGNSPTGGIQELTSRLCIVNGDTKMGQPVADGIYMAATPNQTYTNSSKSHTFHLQGRLTNQSTYKILVGVSMRNRNFYEDGVTIHHYYNHPAAMRATIKSGSYVRITLNSQGNPQNVNADMLPVHEALNKIVECISENALTCKSNLYGRYDSIVNPYTTTWLPEHASPFGAGALKAITNGYKIRNLYSDGETERNMPVSFKDIVEALDALDCIGWGFVEEDGQLYVRVESWEWFYQYNIILTIDNPNEKTLKVNTDHFITSLNIGYKKYTTNEDINAIDSIHSERTFTSKIKAVAKEVSKLCKWIADNYSIEETRRKSIEATSDEFKYDENIFVFELEADAQYSTPSITYRVANDSVTDVENINYAKELYNPRLSPRRMAERWKARLALFNTTSPLELTKGSVNYKAKFACKDETSYGYYKRFYLSHGNVSGKLAEDATIANGTPKMRAETLKIKYPLTIPQYQFVKSNPYGMIKVDGALYWLKEMTFTFKSGEAELTLIPKA